MQCSKRDSISPTKGDSHKTGFSRWDASRSPPNSSVCGIVNLIPIKYEFCGTSFPARISEKPGVLAFEIATPSYCSRFEGRESRDLRTLEESFDMPMTAKKRKTKKKAAKKAPARKAKKRRKAKK